MTGNYAWDATKLIMIAYVQDNSTISSRLTSHLETDNPPNSVKFAVKEMPTVISEVKGDVSYTVHDRKFKYIHRPKSERPGPITLCQLLEILCCNQNIILILRNFAKDNKFFVPP